MWKNIKNDKPKKIGFLKVYGIINEGSAYQTKTKYDVFWDGSKFTDKYEEDLIGLNEGVMFWFDFDEVENPIEVELSECNHENIQLKSSGNIANAVLAADFRPLTQKQIYQLTEGKKHWSEKKEHLIKLAKNFGITISTDEELKYLIEIHCPNEERRIKKQFFIDSQIGKRKTHLTPTDVKGDFTKITRPVIGVKYHISWAFSGAVFKLVKVEGDICYLDNPKYKRKQLLTCKVSELRGLR